MEWKQIQGYENYEVSNEGQVRNKKTGKILKPAKNNCGYLQVILYKDNKRKSFLIQRLVADVWIPNPDNLPEVNHIDENKEDNRVENLEWCTRQYNMSYGTRGKRQSKTQSRKVYCVELDQTFNSIKEAERETGIWHSNITACCQGKIKTTGGYHWKYVDES